MAKVGVTVTGNLDPLKDLRACLAGLDDLDVSVGYHDPVLVPDSDGLTVPTLAAIQEFGTDDIPARPFMKRGAAAADDDVSARELAKVSAGTQSPTLAVQAIGQEIGRSILAELLTAGSWAEPNDPDTIKSKKSSTPLYAGHGSLRKNLTVVVSRGGSEVSKTRVE